MPRLFTDVVRELDSGVTAARLTERLAECVKAVMKTRKKGQITLTLDIAPNGDAAIAIADTIKFKIPEDARGKTNYFANAEGDIMRNDPRQAEMFRAADGGEAEKVRSVAAPASPPRRVAEETDVRRVAAE